MPVAVDVSLLLRHTPELLSSRQTQLASTEEEEKEKEKKQKKKPSKLASAVSPNISHRSLCMYVGKAEGGSSPGRHLLH